MVLRNSLRFRGLRHGLCLVLLAGFSMAQQGSPIERLVAAGSVEGMRWPNFREVQASVKEFYAPTNYAPAWVQGASASPQAVAAIELFRNAWKKGLEPEDYDASRWEGRVNALRGGSGDAAAFDVALTVCAMRYLSDLHVGRINPKHVEFGLSVEQKKLDLAQLLREKFVSGSDLAAIADEVEPSFPTYQRTEKVLADYIEKARGDSGEKLPIPAKAVEAGQPYSGVAALVQRLKLVGDLPQEFQPMQPDVYDKQLAEGVKRFQRRHGLGDDGRLGQGTVKALNVPLSERVRQLQLTLERWRWLPSEFPAPPILVNIPDFRLRALDENGRVAMEMRVVVGKAMRNETPVFTGNMSFIVLRPYWNIPPGIFRRDVLPAIKKDRGHVIAKNFEVTTPEGKLVTDGEVSDDVLARLQAGKLLVRQKPGDTNALGLVKLMFPNEFHVYLHDTPTHGLFSKDRRDFSSGCIRLQKPADLTAWVLRNNPGWTLERVQQGMKSGPDNTTVSLARKVPVFIVYGTAIAYDNGEVHFYDDIYGHDAKLAQALAKGRPYPQ